MTRRAFELGLDEDPCPDLVVERGPENIGVGDWVPKVKHTLLAKYISSAYGAMNRWPHRVFIDPFCGPGRIQVKGEGFTRDGGSVVAWRRAVRSGTSYTQMLLGDLDSERVSAAHLRLRALDALAIGFEGPADETVHRMVRQVPRGALCLAYIDPYNLSLLNFEMIHALAQLPNAIITYTLASNPGALLGSEATHGLRFSASSGVGAQQGHRAPSPTMPRWDQYPQGPSCCGRGHLASSIWGVRGM
jgi:hypothetical protein